MKSDNILLNEYKNGNKEALNILVNKYLYLAKLKLNAFYYDEKYEEDLLQMGYERMLILINKYINNDFDTPLSLYLHSGLYSYYYKHIQLLNNEKKNLYYIDSTYNDEDFIIDVENKEVIEIIKDMILKSDYFTFDERLCLIAKYGLIGGYVINNTEMAKIMNCSSERIRQKLLKASEKLSIIANFKTHKIYEEKNKFNTDIFSFLQTSYELVMYFIEKSSEEKILILKKVWGEDFKNLNNLDNINLTDNQIEEFLSIMKNLQNKILDTNEEEISEIMRSNGVRTYYYPRR